MFVSILQLMGFPMEKPVHSRASENSADQRANARVGAHIEGITAEDVARTPSKGTSTVQAHAQAQSARRTDVKAKADKTPVSAKVPSQPVKAAVLAKHGAKSVAKPAAKPAAKGGSKPAANTNAKVPAKSGSMATPKPPVKTAAKTLAKAAKPGASKTTGKPAATAKNQKPAPKVAATKVNSVITKAPQPAAKPVAKPVVKPAVKVAAKQVAKPVAKPVVKVAAKPTVKPAAKPLAKAAAKTAAAPTAPVKAAPKPVAKAAPSPAAAPAVTLAGASPVPAKAGRPSSRLAQLTVPSMAQSVASTAAKSSFTQTTALPLIVPPLPSATKKDPKLANNWKTKPVEQLSDAELLSMPDSEYMNDKQMAVFRLKLSILKQDILNSASDTTEHLREDTVVVPDPADRATIEEEHALELRTRDRERKLLKKIEQSINRIDAGDYGYCDETGEPIGVGRLLARPTATLSLEAQQRRELKQKMFGD